MSDNLYVAGRPIGSIQSPKLHGAPAVGRFVIEARFILSLEQTKTFPFPRVRAVEGALEASAIAVAQFDHIHTDLRSYAGPSTDHSVVLRAFLNGSVVRELDRRRATDGSLKLSLKLMFDVEEADTAIETRVLLANLAGNQHVVEDHDRLAANGGAPQYPASFIDSNIAIVDSSVSVTRSDWVQILSEMQWEDRVLLEIPVAGGRTSTRFAKAAEHMRRALNQIEHGHWSDALVACREALDEMENIAPNHHPVIADWSDKSKRDNWSIDERLGVARWTVRHLTHAGAHSKIGEARERDARTAVHLTASIYLQLLG